MSPLVGSNGGKGGTPSRTATGSTTARTASTPTGCSATRTRTTCCGRSFEVKVPAGPTGLASTWPTSPAEYPEFVGKKFNDMFIGWVEQRDLHGQRDLPRRSAVHGDGAGGRDGEERASSGPTRRRWRGPASRATARPAGRRSTAKVSPGETLVTFAFAIMDMGDSSKATLAMLDHWRWSCKSAACRSRRIRCAASRAPEVLRPVRRGGRRPEVRHDGASEVLHRRMTTCGPARTPRIGPLGAEDGCLLGQLLP
jgi:hypothetical protein